MLKIEFIKRKIFLNDKLYGKKYSNMDIGDQILNILFYNNKKGDQQYTITIDGIDETEKFKEQTKEKYKDILNTELKDDFYSYANIK